MMADSASPPSIEYINVIDLVTTDEGKKYAPAGRMAAVIIEITQENGGCLPQDLNQRGFTPDEVAQHWHLAKSIAAVEMRMMRDNKASPKARKIY